MFRGLGLVPSLLHKRGFVRELSPTHGLQIWVRASRSDEGDCARDPAGNEPGPVLLKKTHCMFRARAVACGVHGNVAVSEASHSREESLGLGQAALAGPLEEARHRIVGALQALDHERGHHARQPQEGAEQ